MASEASEMRVAQILTDESMFAARCQRLWTEASRAGDTKMVDLCRRAIAGDEIARERVAEVLADAEAQS
jgi:hypothetical protein